MFEKIKAYLKPLSFPEDDDKNRTASLLHTVLLALLVIFIVNSFVAIFFNGNPIAIILNFATVFIAGGLFWLLRRGYVMAAAQTTIIIFWLAVSSVAFAVSGLTSTIITSYFVLVLLAGLLTGRAWSLFFALLSIAVGAIVVFLEQSGRFTPPLPGNLLVNATSAAGNLIALTVILNLTLRILDQSFAKLRNSNAALQKIQADLERRVTERTRAIETGATVSHNLSTILNEQELVREVVTQLKGAFSYYHVHIYLWDKAQDLLVMAGGTGAVGQKLLAQGHALPPGKGLVGRAAATNGPVIVPDVSQAPEWLPNPLLPDTKAEAAVPIALGREVLGVLDVQENQINGLTDEDVKLIQLVANQVATALRNARLVETMEQRAKNEAKINEIRLKIQQTTDVDAALQVAVRELGDALNASRTAVQMRIGPGKNGHTDPE